MVGKATLLYVLGFSFLLAYVNLNMNRAASSAADGSAMYFDYEAAHTLALAGAQMALATLFQDTAWSSPIEYSPSDLPGSYRAVRIGNRIESIATYSATGGATIQDTVEVYLGERFYIENSFTMFAWMTNNEQGIDWITGDTVRGRVHSNSRICVDGRPYFSGPVTTSQSFEHMPGRETNQATYAGGWATRAERIDFPSDLTPLMSAAGVYLYPGEIWITLSPGTPANGDGMIYVRSSAGGSVIDSLSVGAPGFSGVIGGRQQVHVEGTLDGQLTIASQTDIVIENDVVYERDPPTMASDDLLGLVAENNVVIADVAPNWTDCLVDAGIFCRLGSFLAENHTSTTSGSGGLRGVLYFLGSIVQNNRGAVGRHAGGALQTGYLKNYVYDVRLANPAFRPPHFPGFYRWSAPITGWWEGTPRYDFSRLSL